MRNATRLPNAFNVRLALEGVSGILNQPLIHQASVAITKAQSWTRVNRRMRYSKWYSMKIPNLRFLIFNIRIAFHFSFPRLHQLRHLRSPPSAGFAASGPWNVAEGRCGLMSIRATFSDFSATSLSGVLPTHHSISWLDLSRSRPGYVICTHDPFLAWFLDVTPNQIRNHDGG